MFRTEAFEAFIAPARRYPQIWRLIAGCVTGFAAFLLGTMAIVAAMAWLLDAGSVTSPGFVRSLENGATPKHMAIVLGTFIPMALGALAMAAWHRRGLASLLGTKHRFIEFFVKGAGTIVFFSSVTLFLGVVLGGLELTPHVSLTTWMSYLWWAIPLLFIQITAEELVFRGYLQQQMAARFQGFFWWMILPSLVFAAGHFDPSKDPILALMIVFATFLFGVLAADLTRVTGNLAAAMGLHFANNFFSILIIGVPDELSGIALYHTPHSMNDVAEISGFLAFDIGMLLVIWIVIRRIVR